MKAILFASSANSDIPCDLAFINNFSATVDPGIGNDKSQGYQKGSVWINTSAKTVFTCSDDTIGAAVWNETSSASTPGELIAPPAATPTSNGSDALVKGGLGGATSGTGGEAYIQGGNAGTGSNGNGGDVNIVGGVPDGTGITGVVRIEGVELVAQGNAASQDTAATLTAAQLLAKILTSSPAGAINLQLPLASAMDTALPTSAAGDAFDFTVISVVGSTDLPTLTTNTGWTLVGSMIFTAVAGNAGRFRARKTGAGAWTLYRLA